MMGKKNIFQQSPQKPTGLHLTVTLRGGADGDGDETPVGAYCIRPQ